MFIEDFCWLGTMKDVRTKIVEFQGNIYIPDLSV